MGDSWWAWGVPLRWRPAEYVPALSIGNAESDVERFPSPGGRGGGGGRCVQPAALAGASANKKGSLDPFRPKGLRAGPVADGAIRAYNGNSPHEEGCGRWIESSLSTHKSGRGSCEDMTRLRIGVYSKPRRGWTDGCAKRRKPRTPESPPPPANGSSCGGPGRARATRLVVEAYRSDEIAIRVACISLLTSGPKSRSWMFKASGFAARSRYRSTSEEPGTHRIDLRWAVSELRGRVGGDPSTAPQQGGRERAWMVPEEKK